MKRTLPLLVAIGAVLAVLVPYLALGGASYEPTPVADPCAIREWRDPGDLEEVLEQVALSALDGTACALGVSREDLVLAVGDEASLDAFAEANGLSRSDVEEAVREGLTQAIDDAEQAGSLSGRIASLARGAVEAVPPWLVLDALETLEKLSAFLP